LISFKPMMGIEPMTCWLRMISKLTHYFIPYLLLVVNTCKTWI